MSTKYSENRKSPFGLRFSEQLHEKLKASATPNRRSINTEIVHRLEASFEPSRDLGPEIARLLEQAIENEVNARLKAIAAKIGCA
ncbi:Arc family DNA-binding protein [Sinorhizobium meliloti]|uniref:Arc family DNA-binding protein n=1 Tax=Rhizobium meliloti TaxID=382 RepID=UPI0002861513|nr:Arc family DNA-binding protein [Sinorhizobium meliloti]ASP79629.1 Arc family DNA-binding protein [Sinorhizobium meliloti]MQW17349.1 Arc family DNA-binding protein [Sinorhizobium meliloti]CCM66770.1 unnamed protein product [Sinorhizobium meliloti Rm41]